MNVGKGWINWNEKCKPRNLISLNPCLTAVVANSNRDLSLTYRPKDSGMRLGTSSLPNWWIHSRFFLFLLPLQAEVHPLLRLTYWTLGRLHCSMRFSCMYCRECKKSKLIRTLILKLASSTCIWITISYIRPSVLARRTAQGFEFKEICCFNFIIIYMDN
jgi:hypothetical protein